MSFQKHASFEFVVMCDACHAIGAIGDRDWKKVRVNGDGHAIHLCRHCMKHAEWCAVHQCYHLPEQLHRCPCVLCGGLFTARVSQHIEHCPSCRRIEAVAARYANCAPYADAHAHTDHHSGHSLISQIWGRIARIVKH
jgi:hypothetical protein